ncbi:MAG: VWA domain-containing protein [Phycisphaerae bacterium]|nr:VWA domain-containing protein [Phycisphaerae bacterium]
MIPISFERPEWLWLLLIVPVAVAGPLIVRSLAALPAGRRWFVLAVRAALLAALILAMAGAQHVRENRDLAVIFLVDQSRSIPEKLTLAQEEFARKASVTGRRPHDDKAAVISFDGETNIEQLPMRGVFIERITPPVDPDRTDLAKAIRLALATFPEGMAKRIVLLSDGNENAGDALSEAAEAAAAGVSIDVVPLEYEHAAEVMFDRLDVPTQANLQDRVPIRMVLRSKRPASGKLTLYHNGQLVSSEPVKLTAGIRPLVQEMPLNSPGVHKFEARFEPDDPKMDAVVQNNVARGFTFVQGEGSVLLLTTEPSCDAAMIEALKDEHVNITSMPMDQAPEDILEMLDYDAIILANVPADRFTANQKEQLAAYVKDMGGGLVMTGGNEGFGAGGWLGTPVEDVMPVKFDLKQRKEIPRGALALIMHTCEMPRGNYWAEQVSIAAVKTISSLDYVGLIAYGFSGGTQWEIPFQVARSKEAIISQIQKISNRIGDMPDFQSGLDLAYQALIGVRDAQQKHVIIISDGDASPPSSALLSKIANKKITVSTVTIGFGNHVMEPEMKRIAKMTGGRYYRANNPKTLPQIFIKEAKIVRRPLIREVPEGFKPHLRSMMPEVTAGVSEAELPPLTGHVLTTPRSAANEFSRILMSTDKEDPLLVVRQCELGKTIAFTSGWWTHWATQWVAWPKFSKLWAQAIRWAMRQGGAADFEISTRLVGREGRIIVEALDKDASFLNGLKIAGRVVTPDSSGMGVQLQQTGPGRYEGTFPAMQNGHYVAAMTYRKPDGSTGMIKTGLSVSYSPEYRELNTNEALLRQIAERTEGKLFSPIGELSDGTITSPKAEEGEVYRRPVAPSISRRPIWHWILAWVVIPLLLLDVAGRRLASMVAISICVEIVVLIWLLSIGGLYRYWWGWPLAVLLAEAVGWAIRWRTIPLVIQFIESELRGQRAAEAAAVSVSRLKGIREKVREEMAERAKADAERREASRAEVDLEPVDTSARFDLGEAGDRDVGDLDRAVGGAKTQAPPADRRRKPASGGKEGEDESMTSRLLKAKRRAQEERQQDDE